VSRLGDECQADPDRIKQCIKNEASKGSAGQSIEITDVNTLMVVVLKRQDHLKIKIIHLDGA
jgi:myosin-crossreactive antigen